MSEAEAVEIAQPLPSKRMSSIRSPFRRTVSDSRSPHSGLLPSACAVRCLDAAEIARAAVVIEDHVAVQLLEVHQPNTSRARPSAATRRSTSPSVL